MKKLVLKLSNIYSAKVPSDKSSVKTVFLAADGAVKTMCFYIDQNLS